MTENEWIFYLNKYLYKEDTVLAAYNEDCAVIKLTEERYLLLTTDALVENIHFNFTYTDFYSLGVKLAVANLSDIAAMGGEPKWALLTIGSSKALDPAWLDPFMEGLCLTLNKFDAHLVGGDTVKSPVFFVNLALFGETDKPLLRSGAQVGDLLFVSKTLGHSAAFLRYLKKTPFQTIPEEVKKAHLLPEAQVSLGKRLRYLANAAIDISDGLLLDLHRLLLASSVSAEIEESKIPVAKHATLEEALSGGEDYALLFTLPEAKLMDLEKVSRELNITFYSIGKIIEGNGNIYLKTSGGERRKITPRGFDHFTSPLLP